MTTQNSRAHSIAPASASDEDGTQEALATELRTLQLPATFARQLGAASRVLWATDHAVLLPTVSPLAIGHSLLLPRTYSGNILAACAANTNFAEDLTSAIDKFEGVFGETVQFEHGVPNTQHVACGINWAHLHLAALSLADSERLIEVIDRKLGAHACALPDSMRPYVQIKLPNDYQACWQGADISSQTVRKALAEVSGRTQWDWREYFGWQDMISTMIAWQRLSHGAA